MTGRARDRERPGPDTLDPAGPADATDPWTEAEIDEAGRDSFPASDPPPWTLGSSGTAGPAPQDGEVDPPPT